MFCCATEASNQRLASLLRYHPSAETEMTTQTWTPEICAWWGPSHTLGGDDNKYVTRVSNNGKMISKGNRRNLDINLFQCHFIHYESRFKLLGIESEAPRWVSRHPARTWTQKHCWELLPSNVCWRHKRFYVICSTAIFRVCRSVKLLPLPVVTSCKCSINLIISPNPVSSH